MKRLIIATMLIALTATACGKSESNGSRQPSPARTQESNDPMRGWVDVGSVGNDYSNVEKCVGPDMLYENRYDGALAVSPNDSQCITATATPGFDE